nr:hypothetical protein [Agrobacterium sp. rho-13.3]MDX8311940.1 hypothetical protein [Agrobacterium sp. rho-13.3]
MAAPRGAGGYTDNRATALDSRRIDIDAMIRHPVRQYQIAG